MAKNKYPHFNPKEYKIESKIATVRGCPENLKGQLKIGDFND